MDLALELQHLALVRENLQQALEALLDVERLEDILLLADFERQVGGDGIRKLAWMRHVDHRGVGVEIEFAGQPHVLLELLGDRTPHRLDGGVIGTSSGSSYVSTRTAKDSSSETNSRTVARFNPSTSTRMVPLGNFSICLTRASVPTRYKSSDVGSSTWPSSCEASTIR